jgi:5,10-methylenetetrahydromethanopterin reductase
VPIPGSGNVRFGLVRPAALLDVQDEWWSLAEEVGASVLGYGEAQTMFHDPYVVMALTAERTKAAMIGPTVTVPFTRHPTVTANSLSTIQELSGGRAFFGIGPGDFALHQIGERTARIQEFADYALAVRSLCAGEAVEWGGKELRLRWTAGPVPLWMAGDGPRTLELAGRVADGVICGNGATPGLVEWARLHIAKGAAEAGRSIDDLEIWFIARVHVALSRAAGIRDLSFYMARYPKNRFRTSMHHKGVKIDDELAVRITGYNDEFDAWEAYEPDSRLNIELLDKYGLTDWVAEQFLVTGTLDEVVDDLYGLVAAGARNILIPQMLPDIMATTAAAADAMHALGKRIAAEAGDRS